MTTTSTTGRNAYLAHYPRDFANEYGVYAGTPDELDRLAAILDRGTERNTCHRITRKEAIRLGWSRVREAKRDGEQWFGGFAEPDGPAPYADTIEQAIANARQATLEVIDREGDSEG